MTTHLAVVASSGIDVSVLQKGFGGKIPFKALEIPEQKLQSISQLLKQVDEYTKLQQEAVQLCLRVERVTLEYLPSEFRRVGQQELKEFMIEQAATLDVTQLEHLEEMRQKLTEAKQQFLKLQQDLQSAEQLFNQQSRQQSGDLT